MGKKRKQAYVKDACLGGQYMDVSALGAGGISDATAVYATNVQAAAASLAGDEPILGEQIAHETTQALAVAELLEKLSPPNLGAHVDARG